MAWTSSDSGQNAWLIVKSDTTVFPPMATAGSPIQVTKAVYVGGTGDLNVVMNGGQTVLFSAVQAGSLLPISVKQVLSTNTTATLMIGVW